MDFGRLREALATVVGAYLPIPGELHHFWNTSLLGPLSASLPLALAMIFLFSLALSRSRPALLFYVSATGAVLLFSYVKYEGYARHHGNLFLILIAALWLADEAALSSAQGRLGRACLIPILTVQTAVGLFSFSMDFLYPFSAAKETADFLRGHKELPRLLAGDEDYAVSTVAGYLDRAIYYPRQDRMGTYIVWNRARRFVRLRKVLGRARAFGDRAHTDVLLILDRPMSPRLVSETGIQVNLVKSFQNSIVHDEAFYLYRLHSPSPG